MKFDDYEKKYEAIYAEYAVIVKFILEKAIGEYIDAVSEASEDQWYRVIERCAAADSSDMATCRFFDDFLSRLSKAKPSIAAKFLERADDNVLNFLAAFLDGLRDSGSNDKYQEILARYLAEGKRLVAIARHLQHPSTLDISSINEVLKKAIAADDDIAVIECLVLAVKKNEAGNRPLIRDIFIPVIKYLTARQDGRWVHGVWYLPTCKAFFQSLSADEINLALESMVFLPRIEHQAERILVCIAESHPEVVLNFLGRRLDEKLERKVERFESFPYQFHGLEKPLSVNAELAIGVVRNWFHAGDHLFRFNGGRLLSAIFPKFPEHFAGKLIEMAEKGSDEDIEFVIGILQNYKGKPVMHPVFQALVNRLSENDPRLVEIDIALQNTGVVAGEFGFVEAYRRKKAEMDPWLSDPRPRVKGFAEKYVRELDLRIASEQRSAEQSKELRKRAFEID